MCTGAINLYDSRSFPQLGNEGYCKKLAPVGHYELGSSGILTMSQGDSSIDAVVRVEYYIKDKECPAEKFDCGIKNLCIGKSITCDESSDCPNSKDEGTKCDTRRWGPIYTLIVFVGIVVTFCVCTMIVWEETSRRKRANSPLIVNNTVTSSPFDGAYAKNFGAEESKPTVYLPIKLDSPEIPYRTTSPV